MIAEGYKQNFETLKRAIANGDVGIIEVEEKATGKIRVAIAAFPWDEAAGEFTVVPFALMFDGNPYDELNPPNPDGGFHRE